ncbi:MAG: hypothetical protein AAGA67_08155 [Cyanobacteria bacterium P01_F01_bin.153]
MTLREQLQREVERLPDRALAEALRLVRRLQTPQAFDWDGWWGSWSPVSEDFMVERSQLPLPQRDSWCD